MVNLLLNIYSVKRNIFKDRLRTFFYNLNLIFLKSLGLLKWILHPTIVVVDVCSIFLLFRGRSSLISMGVRRGTGVGMVVN